MLYPSWPSLVFLLWSCGIWLIPKLDPRKSVFYTSPLLVIYSFVLLLIQYAYSLDLTMEEFTKNKDIVIECSKGRREGCKSLALLAKVSTCTLSSTFQRLHWLITGSVFCSSMQTFFTVIFFASFREFVRVAKIKVPQWWQKYRHQRDGEMLLTELHDDEGIVSFPSQSTILRLNFIKSLVRLTVLV